MSSRKISKKKLEAFEEFKKEFKEWQETLQCLEYQMYFELKELEDNYADIAIDEENKLATVCVDVKTVDKFPHEVAKHEALHMFLNALVNMGKRRFITKDTIDIEWERMTRILEKLL